MAIGETEHARSKWFGVRGSSANASMTTGVKGLELMMDSISARTVKRESSVNVCCNSKAFKICLIVRIIPFLRSSHVRHLS